MHTFAFVDIVGFTAYTARFGDVEGARLAVGAGTRIRSLLPAHGAEEVKALGDGMMIRAADAAAALRLAARLAEEAGAGRMPQLRIGVESGPAVTMGGDWYGTTVNRAARLCAAARPGEVLVGARARQSAHGVAGLAFRRRFARARDLSLRTPVYAAVPAAGRPLMSLACPRHALGRTA